MCAVFLKSVVSPLNVHARVSEKREHERRSLFLVEVALPASVRTCEGFGFPPICTLCMYNTTSFGQP